MDEPVDAKSLGERLAWGGLIAVALMSIARAMIEHDPFPWWSSDPFVFSPPIVGLTPRWALLLHAGIVFASMCFFIGQAIRGKGLQRTDTALLLVGLVVLGYHALWDIERVLNASGIAAVMCVLVVASQAWTLPNARRVMGSVTIGFALMLGVVGVYEVFVSHPQTLQVYEQGRDAFFSARGWSEGSFEALAYERRLRNPEPVAWFGLTNVVASFAAASAGGLFTIAMACWRSERLIATLATFGAIFALFMLMLSGSKGGFGVLGVGMVLGVACVFWSKRTIDGRAVLLLCGFVVLGLIMRGLLGEASGERSLLFRFQYLVGALNIWLQDPLLGCGPGQFQDQYALLKPPLSPEDVASPHSVMLSWLATLGIGGIAIAALLLRTLLNARGCRAEQQDEENPAPVETDRDSKLALLLIVIPTLIALRMQSGVLDLGGMLAVLGGGVLWGALSVWLIRSALSSAVLGRGLFIAAAILMLHAMLEVTGTLIVSAPLWAFMVGIACNTSRVPQRPRKTGLIASVGMLGIGVVLLVRWGAINEWERSLHAAAQDAPALAEVHAGVNRLEYSQNPGMELRSISMLLESIIGRSVDESLDAIIPTLTQAEIDARYDAVERLQTALEARPTHTPTRVALSQQLLWLGSVAQAGGDGDRATAFWDRSTELFTDVELSASGHRWAGSIWSGRVSAFPDSERRQEWLRQALQHWERALALAPHDPHTAIRLMEASLELGDDSGARSWAQRAIELHHATRLDPLRGLSDADLARSRVIAER